jgi:uncharacterized protein (TIGR02246 family)
MKRILAVSTLLVVAALSVAQADEAKEKQVIQKRHDEWAAAWNKHDPKVMAAFWVEEGDLIDPFGKHAKGPAEIEKLFTGEHTGKGVMVGTTYAGTVTDIRLIDKDAAVVDVEAEVRGMLGPDGKPAPPFKHHVTWVAKKKDGRWMAFAARPAVAVPVPETAVK